MRRPNESMSQRRLVYALKYAIDEGKMGEAANLAALHPRGMRSRHVTHNVGRARARALDMSIRARSLGTRSDA